MTSLGRARRGPPPLRSAPARIVVVGAGGNIGSHLVPHLGRMPGVGEVVLIDRGVYDSSNLATQDITPCEVGQRKAVALARRLREINPALVVRPLAQPVEDVPLGCLRADVLLACLDSRAARQFVNQAACRLGVPWIDAGVHADGMLARISPYLPGPDRPCMECAWDARDYAALEQTYPCGGGAGDPPATGGPSSLGALAAALQAIECRKFVAGSVDRVAFGREVVIDASSHQHYVTAFRRNPACRMPEHEPWTLRRFPHAPADATLGQVLRLGRRLHRATGRLTLSVAGSMFATKLTCPACGSTRPILGLKNGQRAHGRCHVCKSPMVVAGFDLRDELDLDDLVKAAGSRSLRSVGLRGADVFAINNGSERLHFVFDGDGLPTKAPRGAGGPDWHA